jgi:hypothetical protein
MFASFTVLMESQKIQFQRTQDFYVVALHRGGGEECTFSSVCSQTQLPHVSGRMSSPLHAAVHEGGSRGQVAGVLNVEPASGTFFASPHAQCTRRQRHLE